MIWQLAHPIRGIVGLLIVLVLGTSITGFGTSLAELVLVLVASIAALAVAGRERKRAAA